MMDPAPRSEKVRPNPAVDILVGMTGTDSGRRPVTATYRLQLRPEFGFADAAAIVPYLARLGVSHLYLSPVLQAAPGSTHGYDVIDHGTVSAQLGGEAAFDELGRTAREHGLGLVVDVVPNHMCVPAPEHLNAAFWSVLRDGPESAYAEWFDIDWDRPEASRRGRVLLPVLGRRVDECLAAGELTLDDHRGEPIVRYADHAFPVRTGTEGLPLQQLLDRQFYRLSYWRLADDELNYRRFFDVDTLAGLRVERSTVFAASHERLARWYAEGRVDGFRIDHPDGLADPAGYLDRLQRSTGGTATWVVVEKILEGEETLPATWTGCAGTTGYDALWRIQGLFLNAEGVAALRAAWHRRTGEPPEIDSVVERAKREVVETVLQAEVDRLVSTVARLGALDPGLRDFTAHRLAAALRALLVAVPVYRVYVVPGEPATADAGATIRGAARVATASVPELSDEIDLLADLALGVERGTTPGRTAEGRAEFCVRFQQTTGPAMAKGVEDTAYYRWFPLAALTEVGSDPHIDAVAPERFHGWLRARAADGRAGMVALSTHDTKRSEDLRARLCVLSERPGSWDEAVTRWETMSSAYRPPEFDTATAYLLWQTLVGAWPIDADRLVGYLEKATREAKVHTSWTRPVPAYDVAVADFARAVLADRDLIADVEAFVATLASAERAVVLGARLVQLTCGGVPDIYQGCELTDRSLVDPDNRRPVDYAQRTRLLGELEAGRAPRDLAEEKLWVTRQALRHRAGPDLRRTPLSTDSAHAFGYLQRDRLVTVVTRLSVELEAAGGWGTTTIELPRGRWCDVLTDRPHSPDGTGRVSVAALFGTLPVALLRREA